jgi:hypothetical protein
MPDKKESTGRSTGMKRRVRARMAEKGIKYTQALREVLAEKEDRERAQPPASS